MAKRFVFRLETVRRLRKQKEDDCRRIVAQRLRLIGRVRQRISDLNAQLRDQHECVRRLSQESGTGQPLSIPSVRSHHDYATHLHAGIEEAHRELSECEEELQKEQQSLAEASRQVKVLDKLEERQRARHSLSLQRAERTESDEIAGSIALRQRIGSSRHTEAGA